MPHSEYKITTERLILRPTSKDDALFILNLMNSPKWIKFIGDRNVKTVEEAETYIKERMLPQLARLGFTNNTVIRKEDGSKIGSCGLYDREGLEGVDIGFAFLPEYEKKGYAFEAANALKNYAVNNWGLTKIKAITMFENTSSQKLLEKIGLTYKEKVKLVNDPIELMLYEWNK